MAEDNDKIIPGFTAYGCRLCGFIAHVDGARNHPNDCAGSFGYIQTDGRAYGLSSLVPPGEVGTGMIKASNRIQSIEKDGADVGTKAEVRTTSSTGGQKGVKLARFDLIPIGALTHLAEHYGRGALKYASHQWRQGYEYSKSYAALLRHLTAWWGGEDFDVCPEIDAASKDEETRLRAEFSGCAFNDNFPFEVGRKTCYNHTGGHHIDAVMWHAMTLRTFIDDHPNHDDRYKPKN